MGLREITAGHDRIVHEQHRLAMKWRWYLEVQREALGLRQHHMVDELYVIPGPIEPSH